jgi:hypothetical protein
MSEIVEPYSLLANRLLYFSSDDSSERRKIYEDLFLRTWVNIPQDSHEKILQNLDFILCKSVKDIWQNETPACALLNRINLRCFVVFDPFSGFLKEETKIHILAHEFSHVFYNHPMIGFQQYGEEKKYIDELAEPEAYALTQKWGILPHPDDIGKLSGYKKYILKTK